MLSKHDNYYSVISAKETASNIEVHTRSGGEFEQNDLEDKESFFVE